jgi:hypothetical protein
MDDLRLLQCPEFMDEPDTGIELRVSGEPLFETGHADQDQAYVTLVENGPYLLQTLYPQPVCLINDYQACWVLDLIAHDVSFDHDLRYSRFRCEDTLIPFQPVAKGMGLRP